MRKIYYEYEATEYTDLLFEAYYMALVRAYSDFNKISSSVNIYTLKNILLLIAGLLENFYTEKYAEIEKQILDIKNEKEFIIVCCSVFELLAEKRVEVNLFRQVFISQITNETNFRIVEIMKAIANMFIGGDDDECKRYLFMFYLAFRHKLKSEMRIDNLFLEKHKLLDITRKVISAGNKAGIFTNPVPKISGMIT